ncbi:MFS transporter [Actinosynnema sp. NPDC023794]
MTTRRATSSPAQEASGKHPWGMLAALLLGQFMALLDVTIVNVAMPTIGVDLDASGASLQLVVGGYTVAYATLLITGARLGDLHGRRRTYLIGVIGFTVASLVCGVAPATLVLIVARFVQGAAAAVMVPQIMSVIQTRFTGQARAKALSAYGAVLSVGAVAGMVLGGVIVNADIADLTWRPAFLVNVPIGIALVLLVPKLMEADAPRGTRELDLVGLAVSVPAVFLIVLPLVLGHEAGWPAWTFTCVALGLVLAVVFVVVEKRVGARGGDPLLNLDVFKAAGTGTGTSTLLLNQIAYGGFLFAFALHLQQGLGDSALFAGLAFTPMAAAFGLVGFFWRELPPRIHHLVPTIGMVLCALGYTGIAASAQSDPHGALMWVSLVVGGGGVGLAFSPLLVLSLVHVPMREAADASGLLTTTMQLGQVTGIAVFGSVFLTLAGRPLTPESSSDATTSTATYLAVLAAVAAIVAVFLARTVARAKRAAAAAA